MNDPTYQKLDYSTKKHQARSRINNKQMQIDAVKAVGEYFGDSRRQDSRESRQMLSQLFGGVEQTKCRLWTVKWGRIRTSNDGFNQGSGIDLPGLGTGWDLPGEIFDFGA